MESRFNFLSQPPISPASPNSSSSKISIGSLPSTPLAEHNPNLNSNNSNNSNTSTVFLLSLEAVSSNSLNSVQSRHSLPALATPPFVACLPGLQLPSDSEAQTSLSYQSGEEIEEPNPLQLNQTESHSFFSTQTTARSAIATASVAAFTPQSPSASVSGYQSFASIDTPQYLSLIANNSLTYLDLNPDCNSTPLSETSQTLQILKDISIAISPDTEEEDRYL
jgi:hypothetical protein